MLAIVAAVAIGVWAYFGVIERLNKLETSDTLFQADLLKKAEQEPKNLEMFMATGTSARRRPSRGGQGPRAALRALRSCECSGA